MFPPEEVGFYRLVEQTFLVLKGSGLMLSATDSERVRGWQGTGVPARVVCDAIEESFAACARGGGGRDAAPRSLAYCAPAVDGAIAGWRERQVG